MLPKNYLAKVDTQELRDGTSALSTVVDNSAKWALPGQVEKYRATVISDSVLPGREPGEGTRITTFVAVFPRAILAEMNTHRVFSRNSASSRARSVASTIRDVMEHPYIPFFTGNRPGMTGEFIERQKDAAYRWLRGRDLAVASALSLLLDIDVNPATIAIEWEELATHYYDNVYRVEAADPKALNVHKQNVNRMLEPYMWHEAVITSTMWENFLALRDHDEADPGIRIVANLMALALSTSVPVERDVHAPFLQAEADASAPFNLKTTEETVVELKRLLDLTAGHGAQVSYRPVVANTESVGADPAKLTARLLKMYHMSPFEHSAVSADRLLELGVTDGVSLAELNSNLGSDWVQNRVLVERNLLSV